MTEQAENLQRVGIKLAPIIFSFCVERWKQNRRTFRMSELVAYVQAFQLRLGAAPDSPSRVLRVLRQEGRIDYKVISRAASQYELTSAPKT